jgi:hypothetical protein
MTLAAARSSVFGRERKISRKKEENESARPNFWNGANGSLRRLLFIVPRARTFQRMSESELDWEHDCSSRDELPFIGDV